MNKLNKNLKNYILPVCLIIILSFSRLIPHPWNFTPILATGIFSGFYFKQFYLSAFIVIFSMFLGDVFLGFHSAMFFTYISLVVAVVLGFYMKNFKMKETIFIGFLSSLCFFILTNFGVWLISGMYEKNLSGLMQSYVLAIPFFHNTLISTFLYLILIKIIINFAINKKLVKISF